MKADALLEKMRDWVRHGNRAFDMDDIRSFFPDEKPNHITTALSRLAKRGKIVRVCRGIYALNEDVRSFPFLLEHVAAKLRRGDYVYLSHESFLSECSVISQQMLSGLTLMTTGARGVIKTKLGTIYFTSTKRNLMAEIDRYSFSHERQIYIPTLKQAMTDLRRSQRNLDLVDHDLLQELLDEQK